MEKLDANLETQFDLNLIEAVKQNPVIYDRSHYNYKHFVRKAQTWKQIAELLGVPGKYLCMNIAFVLMLLLDICTYVCILIFCVSEKTIFCAVRRFEVGNVK